MDDFERALREAGWAPKREGAAWWHQLRALMVPRAVLRALYDAGVRDGERETMTPAELAQRVQAGERWAVGDD